MQALSPLSIKVTGDRVLSDQKIPSFSSKANAISQTLFQEYSKVGAEKNFCFFSPCVLPHLSLIYAAAPTSLKQAFENEFKLEEMSEQEWHRQMSGWTANIVSHVKELQSLLIKPFEFKLASEQAVALKNDLQLMPEAKIVFDNTYQAEHIAFDT